MHDNSSDYDGTSPLITGVCNGDDCAEPILPGDGGKCPDCRQLLPTAVDDDSDESVIVITTGERIIVPDGVQ